LKIGGLATAFCLIIFNGTVMKKITPAILIAWLYFVMGVLWVYLTDKLVFELSPTTESFLTLRPYKSFLYIFITSFGLYLLIRRSSKKLRKKGEEYELLFEENPNAMWVCSQDHSRFLAVNRAALQQYGYDREEFLALSPLDIRPEEDRQAFLQTLKEHDESLLNVGQWRLLRKSGEIRYARIYWHKLIFQGQEAFLGLITDITSQFQAEEERKKLIDELTRQNQDLQQFAYITSHNLRAPIANIMGLVNLYSPGNKPEFNRQILDQLGESARNLDTVVRDLNDLLVIRTKQKEEKQVVRFENVFHFIQQSISADINASQARIEADFTRAPEVVCVRSYVQSILYNLLTNAMKYRSPDRALQVEVQSYREGDFICLAVKDNGLGIDLEKNRHKLFGMYKRFHKHVDGKGLGLHLVKTQIEAVGGSIAVESEKGKGSTFKVLFPNGHEP
jgi:PAS domain S-box-containing protein